MDIQIGQTEYGLPKVEWTQRELFERQKIPKKYLFPCLAICMLAVFFFVFGFFSILSNSNDRMAPRGPPSDYIPLSMIIGLLAGGLLGLHLNKFIYDLGVRKYVLRDSPYWLGRPYRAKLMLGNSPECNLAPALLSMPSSDHERKAAKDHPGMYHLMLANEVVGFSIDTAQRWLGMDSRDPVYQLILANLGSGDAFVVAWHHGSVAEVNALRAALQRTFIDARPPKGWPDPSQQVAPQAAPAGVPRPKPAPPRKPRDVI